jgi:hypothetical protein
MIELKAKNSADHGRIYILYKSLESIVKMTELKAKNSADRSKIYILYKNLETIDSRLSVFSCNSFFSPSTESSTSRYFYKIK